MVRMLLFEAYEKLRMGFVGPLFRHWGKKLINQGLALQGDLNYADRSIVISKSKK